MSSSFVSVVNEPESTPASAHFWGAEIRSDRQNFLLLWGRSLAVGAVPRVRLQLVLGDDRAEVSLDNLERLENRPLR
jgi:hypothetical protein